MWAVLARATGTQLDESTAQSAVASARRCIGQPITVGTIRAIGFCHTLLGQLGQGTPVLAVPAGLEQAEAVIEGASLGIFDPTGPGPQRAVAELASRSDEAPTHSIAQALILSGEGDAPLHKQLAQELAERRVRGSALYGNARSGDVVDLYATYWVARSQTPVDRGPR